MSSCSKSLLLLLVALTTAAHGFQLFQRSAPLLAARRSRSVRLQSDDGPEVTAWARSEAARRCTLYAKAASEIKPPHKGVLRRVLFYNAYAAGFTLLLVRTLMKFPLVPPAPSSLAWNSAWLVTTVVDYYGAALALCGVIVASESRRDGILWSLGCLLLGTPFCCFYVATRLLRKGTLRLSD